MSSGGFHVHGPHDHEIEHATQGGHADHGDHDSSSSRKMTSQIALFTAMIATVGAIFGYMGGATQANAGLFKNNAAIKKTEAANKWSYYQSKSGKQNLWELALEIVPAERRPNYSKEIDRYKSEKEVIKLDAEKLEAESTKWDKASDEQMHQHHRWAQATTVLQVAIALAAIALLTKRKWLEYGMFFAGALGVCIGALALMHI
jgi:Na+/glutamate symporter